MYLAVREYGYLGVGKFLSVTEYLYSVLGAEEALRLRYIDLVFGDTAVDLNCKRSIVLTKKRLYDKVLCRELYAEA